MLQIWQELESHGKSILAESRGVVQTKNNNVPPAISTRLLNVMQYAFL